MRSGEAPLLLLLIDKVCRNSRNEHGKYSGNKTKGEHSWQIKCLKTTRYH